MTTAISQASGPAVDHAASPRPPAIVWGAVAAVAALRMVPFLWVVAGPAPAGSTPLPTPYVTKDWLAYVAFIRQGIGPYLNPFTTDPQDGRVVLLLHQALGAVHAATGVDPFWLLELARIPLLALFAWALWTFVSRIFESDDVRRWATVLVLLSGGFGWAALIAEPLLPEAMGQVVRDDLRTEYGWSTFDAAFNPLWIAGLTLVLVTVSALVAPGRPAGARDVAVASAGLFGAYLVHPYSAVIAAAAVAGALAATAVGDLRVAWRRALRVLVAVLPGVAACALLALWQRQDPAFRAASDGFFGPQDTPVFWYPVAFGAVGFFALRGLRAWSSRPHPWRDAIVGWIGALALLHSSNLVNGYHFVFGVHLPIAILAASPVAAAWAAHRSAAARGALVAALFAAPVATTVLDGREASALHLASPVADLLERLGEAPPGNVLAPPPLGNLVPAYGPHRVFVGHWFLTPDHDARAALYEELVWNPARAAELVGLLQSERIRYLVVPRAAAPRLVPLLRSAEPATFGELALLRLW